MTKRLRFAVTLISVTVFAAAVCATQGSLFGHQETAVDRIVRLAFPSLTKENEAGEATGSPNAEDQQRGGVEPVEFWPPVAGRQYPDLVLEDSDGRTVRLSDYRGKVILLELAAIPCQGCQAFSGGNMYGGYGGVRVQSNLESIHEYARQFAGIDLDQSDDVVFVQLLLYGKRMGRPTREEVRGWADHFRLNGKPNHLVLRGDPSMVNHDTFRMIPGFHLIDRDFVLRSDSCGHSPRQNLYSELLPTLRKLVGEPSDRHAETSPTWRRNPFLDDDAYVKE